MKFILMRVTAAALFFIFCSSVSAMDWPSDTAVIVRSFGSNNEGSPVLGIVFSGGTEALAAESGEVIFSRNRNDAASRLPSPLGAFTAVDHGDGLISIYSRYSDEDSPDKKTMISKNQQIASCGVSGWSGQDGFYFIVFDRRERRWINPVMIITPVQDTRPPQIISVELQNSQGELIQSRNLNQGRYTIVVNAAGGTLRTAPGPAFLQQYAPQKIVCSVNGAEVGSLNFEAVSARDGVLVVYRNGLVPAKQIYAAFPAFAAAEVFLTRGQASLEVIVQDIAGNTRNFVSRLIIN